MPLLTWISSVYSDIHTLTTQYPVLLGTYGFLAWLGGIVPRKWLIQKLKLAYPLDRIPLEVAGAYLLGKIEGGFISNQVRRNKSPAETLQFLAHYLANQSKLTGIMPPSSSRTVIQKIEFSRGSFRDGGGTFYYHHSEHPKFTSISITRWRLWLAVRKLNKIDTSNY